MQIRQGDVFLEEIKELPKNIKKKKGNLIVIGESFNHGHYIYDGEIFINNNEDMFVKATDETSIQHLMTDTLLKTDEHKSIELKEGFYKIILQREYNPYLQSIINVLD